MSALTKAGTRMVDAFALTNLDPLVAAGAILNGTSLSTAVPLTSGRLVGISVPVGWTAAAVSFQVSPDGGATFFDLYDKAGAEVTFTPVAGKMHQLDPNMFVGFNQVKIRSGTTGAPVLQLADRALTLVAAGG